MTTSPSSNKQIAATRTSVPQLEQFVDSLNRATLLGQESLVNYYNAVQQLSSARLNLLKLRGKLANDWVSVELASGEPLSAPMPCMAADDAGRAQ